MTGAEIIKAMECCIDIGINACDDCPFQERCVTGEFIETEAIDLINTQKAEIEKLKEQVNLWQEEAGSVGCANEWLKAYLKNVKAEAIKEFAKRLKANSSSFQMYGEPAHYIVTIDGIDYLVKEMVGEG
jgi:FtsZ-binding cell division protein ZapB